MKKAAIPALVVVIFLAFGIILAAVVIVWGLNKFTEMVNGKCWADMEKTMSDVKSDLNSASGLPKTKKIVMGDCVGGAVAFNKDMPSEIQPFSKWVDEYCPKSDSYNSYVLILPWKTLKAESGQDKSIWTRITEKFTWKYYADTAYSIYQTARFIKPGCIGLDARFQDTYFIPQELKKGPANLNEKNIALCYSLSRIARNPTTDYKYDYEYVLGFQKELSKPEDDCMSGGGTFGGGGTSGTY